MKYNYALIVGLLVSLHGLMGSEKDPIWLINTIPKDPTYEKCEEVKNILKKYAIDSIQKRWQISSVPGDSSYYKENAGKICLVHDELSGSSRLQVVCGGENTAKIRDIPYRCNTMVNSLERKINHLETLLKPQEMDYTNRAIEACGGIFLLSTAGIFLKNFLSTGSYSSKLLYASASLGIGSISIYLLLRSFDKTYSCIQHNNNCIKNYKDIESSITTHTTEKNNWNKVGTELSTIIALITSAQLKNLRV